MHSLNKENSLAKKIEKYFTKPPILFTLAALFQLIFTVWAIISLYPIPLSQRDWLRPLGMALFTLLSFGLCSLRKPFAIAYVLLTTISIGLLYICSKDSSGYIFGDSYFPFNIILSFFVLLLFKKFTKK